MKRDSTRPAPAGANAGFAIGPILFVIAILALLAAVISADPGGLGTASIADRVSADVGTQANLIRAKINECTSIHGTDSNYDGYPPSDISNGTLVSALNCIGDQTGQQSVWQGERPALLPPPTAGFGPWYYINTDNCTPQTGNCLSGTVAGGRCIWSQPLIAGVSAGIGAGLAKAASKFSNGASFNASNEVIYDPASSSQKFIVWITMPTGTPDSHCLP